jgi:hypothetical protein
VSENLVVGIHVYDGILTNPKVSFSTGGTGATHDTTLSVYGVGPTLTYYAMPSNIYWTGTVAVTWVTVSAASQQGASELGIGVRTGLGKEWWVSDHWGLGLAAHVLLSSNADAGAGGSNLFTWSCAVAFSATYQRGIP